MSGSISSTSSSSTTENTSTSTSSAREEVSSDVESEIEKLYREGMSLESKSPEKAVKLFHTILSLKPQTELDEVLQVKANFNIGCKAGDKGDEKEAKKWWTEAAKKDHPMATYYLAVMHERKGDSRAVSFYRKAAQLGCEKASRALKDLGVDFLLAKPLVLGSKDWADELESEERLQLLTDDLSSFLSLAPSPIENPAPGVHTVSFHF